MQKKTKLQTILKKNKIVYSIKLYKNLGSNIIQSNIFFKIKLFVKCIFKYNTFTVNMCVKPYILLCFCSSVRYEF